MYFDTVVDEKGKVLFNGTPDETRQWLTQNMSGEEKLLVVGGEWLSVMRPTDYLDSGS